MTCWGWYNWGMGVEQRLFPKMIQQGKRKGEIQIGGRTFLNPIKDKPPIDEVHLRNLEPLAIIALDEDGDSAGQSHLDDVLGEAKTRYLGEQPDEMWRRELAALMNQGRSCSEIAEALMRRNERVVAAVRLKNISEERLGQIEQTIEGKLALYWPSSKPK